MLCGFTEMNRRIWISLLLIICLSSGCTPRSQIYEAFTLEYFDTVCRISARCDSRSDFDALTKQVFFRLEEYHLLCDAISPRPGVRGVYALNQAAGTGPFTVDDELYKIILFGLDMAARTDGAVNIALGSVTLLWKETAAKALEDPENAALPDAKALASAALMTDYTQILMDDAAHSVSLPAGMKLDLGAIAKGWAAEEIARELEAQGRTFVLLDLGGNLRAVGGKNDDTPWIAGIDDPFNTSELLYTLPLSSQALVTSGSYQRYFEIDGQRYCHIIDPETMAPATRFASVTVQHRDSAVADALSTALFNLPMDRGSALLRAFGGAKALWITVEGQEARSPGFALRNACS